jgi:membrane protease YdiL (CAAX protease family)
LASPPICGTGWWRGGTTSGERIVTDRASRVCRQAAVPEIHAMSGTRVVRARLSVNRPVTDNVVHRPEQGSALPPEARLAPPSDDSVAAGLRGFGPLGLLAILLIAATTVFKPLSASLVLFWAWRSRTPWREIGYVRPKSWPVTVTVGIVFGCAFKIVMKAIVMPLVGAPAINLAYHYLVGNRAALPGAILTMIVAAGFSEETLFRGYLFERLGKLLGTGTGARVSVVLLSSALFAAGHYSNLGFPGVEQAMITGLVFGTIFAITGRIWMVMCAHAAFDLAAVAIIYLNLESAVAHLVFR